MSYDFFNDRYLNTDNNIQLITRYLVQSTINPSKNFVYESLNTLRIGETVFINNEPYIVLSRA